MKKIALLLAIVMLIGCMAGCAKDNKEDDVAVTPTSASGETTGQNVNPDANENADASEPYAGELIGSESCVGPEHKMTSVVEQETDCESYGHILHTCSLCGWSYQEQVEPLGHDYSPASCEFDAYCNRCQAVVEPATGHTTTNGLCEKCGAWIDGQSAPAEADQSEPSGEDVVQ